MPECAERLSDASYESCVPVERRHIQEEGDSVEGPMWLPGGFMNTANTGRLGNRTVHQTNGEDPGPRSLVASAESRPFAAFLGLNIYRSEAPNGRRSKTVSADPRPVVLRVDGSDHGSR